MPAKTECIIIGHSRKVNTLNISKALMLNDSIIKLVDKNLQWDEHYNTVKAKSVVDLHH